MKRLLYVIGSKILKIFGDMKVFKYPMWFVYDPFFFKMTGEKIMEVMKTLEPGDVILRGYDSYLDSKCIPSQRGYSHGAIYIGNDIIVHAVAEGVSEVNVIDFCECDRICILRPKKYKKEAVRNAKLFLKQSIPYDFGFNAGVSALYCFELVAEAYPKLNIRRVEKKALFGLLKKNVYLSDSMFESPDLDIIFEYNPKYKINFKAFQ